MKNTFRFICEEHQEYGENGWRLESHPGFDPLGGGAVAHDVLEHFPDGDESPACEFMALGASMLIRGVSGYMQRNGNVNPPSRHLASDFPDILRHVLDEGMELPKPGRTRPVDDYDWMLKDTIAEARKMVRSEYPDDAKMMLPLVPRALGWMRKGFNKALRRYEKCGVGFATLAFEHIEEHASKMLLCAPLGTVIEVELDLANDHVEVREVEPDYPEED